MNAEKATTRRASATFATAIVTVVVSLVATIAVGVAYVTHVVGDSQKQLCGVIRISTQPRPTPPTDPNISPSSQYGRDLQAYLVKKERFDAQGAREMTNLERNYHC